MGYIEGFAGFAYLVNDFIAIFALTFSAWIAVMAFINLGYYRYIDAPWKAYSAFVLSVLVGIGGQVALYVTNMQPTKMGFLGQSPEFTNSTLVCALAIFVLSRFLRSQKSN